MYYLGVPRRPSAEQKHINNKHGTTIIVTIIATTILTITVNY